jgi:crotonobetainyl-CoA:carnitine CoA-transferase CaiB-like acyl-CoA transferase
VTGIFTSTAILAALQNRHVTGLGQYIDMSLLDSQVGWLANVGLQYLTSGNVPQRLGNEHPSIVPYSVVKSADGFFILAVGNDSQFQKFCSFAGNPEWAADERFKTNPARVKNRVECYALVNGATETKPTAYWMEGLEKLGVPVGPVNDIGQVFADPQVLSRGMKVTMPHPLAGSGTVDLIGNPIKLSESPVDYKLPPPTCGQHTDEVLKELLFLEDKEIAELRAKGIV